MWMEDGEKAKNYDEILKIVETVNNAKVASTATLVGQSALEL